MEEKAIRAIVHGCVDVYASAFSDRHLRELDDDEGTINSKIHNVFISVLGPEIQYYSALSRSLDSSLGNMLEKMAIMIARLNYTVSQHVEGVLYKAQTDYIAELLERYKRHAALPSVADYENIHLMRGEEIRKRHESDYYLTDEETGKRYLIELKIGGDLDNKKARSEKEAILEQYCILTNSLGPKDVKILFASYGEGLSWRQKRVRQFFAEEELCISSDFWNFICKSPHGYDTVIDEYKQSACLIKDTLKNVRGAYLPGLLTTPAT